MILCRHRPAVILLVTAIGASGVRAQELSELNLRRSASHTEYLRAVKSRPNHNVVRDDRIWVFRAHQPNTVALNLYWNYDRLDSVLAVEDGFSAREYRNLGYRLVRTEGFIYPLPRARTVGLRLFWSDKNRHHVLAVEGGEMERTLRKQGYVFIRTEGFAPRRSP